MSAKDYTYDRLIRGAYIIRMKANPISTQLATRCAESCRKVGQPWAYYEAFTPNHAPIQDSWLKWIKVTDRYLSETEIACAYSHISLWAKCMELDAPIIILEHDAIMLAPLQEHPAFGCILYLGGREQHDMGWPVTPTPPHATNGVNYHFLCRAHAYAVDPQCAKAMMAHVIKYGIHESLDIMLRSDIFPAVQTGLYAYDSPGETTILDRKRTPDNEER